MMRVCLVSMEVAPFRGAGIGTYVASAARAWSESGHECHLLTAPHPEIEARGAGVLPGVRFHVTDPGAGRAGSTALWRDFQRHSMAVLESLERLHSEHPFDYIEFPEYWGEGYYPLLARRAGGALEGAVLGVKLHTPSHECRRLNLETWVDESVIVQEQMEDASIEMADIVFSPSRGLVDLLLARFGERAALGLREAHVVPYPYYVDDVEPIDAESARASGQSILYFGRLERRKGVDLLIRAAEGLLDAGRDLRVRLVGGDTPSASGGRSMCAHLRSMVRPAWRDRFEFVDHVARDRLPAMIREATLCCFPSRWENFPNVCLEAMSQGALVVGSDAGGMAEMIEDGASGLLFRSGEAGDLRAALERGLDDERLRARARVEARRRVAEQCDPRRVTARMVQCIETHRPRDRGSIASASAGWDAGIGAARARTARAPLVSIIVPFYNLSEYLPATIASIRKQTWTDYEVIVVDDGSTDRAARAMVERIERGGRGWEGLRLVRKANGGLSSARNAGIAAARGEWILPLDADDMLHPGYLERVVQAARRNPETDLITTFVAYFHGRPGDVPAETGDGWAPLGLVRDLLYGVNCASSATALIRRETIGAIGGYDETLTSFEDWDLYCSMAERGARCVIVPEFLFYYRYRPDSMVRTEGLSRRGRLRSYLIARHPDLPEDHSRAARVLLSQVSATDPLIVARRVLDENLRYRVVDRLNAALRRTPIHATLKVLTQRALAHNDRASS